MTREVKIKNYENYGVNGLGGVFSMANGNRKKLKPVIMKKGYSQVTLYSNKKPKKFLIHRLVAFAFLGDKSDNLEINHKNKVRSDNRLENIEWVTRSYNAYHKYKTYQYPQGSSHCRSKLDEETVMKIKFYIKNGIRICDISRKLNIHQSTIGEIKQGRTWSHLEGY